jgi:hypothetical protein
VIPPFGPNWNRESGKRIGEAVVLAGLSAVAVKLGEWGVESVRAWWTRRKSENQDGAA